jgi:hypothetical protein
VHVLALHRHAERAIVDRQETARSGNDGIGGMLQHVLWEPQFHLSVQLLGISGPLLVQVNIIPLENVMLCR